MGGFILVESDYSNVPSFLISEVQGFEDSLEYGRLDEVERSLPGVVAAAFTTFLVRFQDAEVRDGLANRDAKTLADAYEAIETLARKRDDKIRILIEDEILENVRAPEATWRAIKRRLGPQSRLLFDEWRKRNSR